MTNARTPRKRPPCPRKRIVEAAINCIERDGLHEVTIRGIAREAGVNSAAISYYFRSKDTLIAEALALTLQNAFGDWEVLLRERSSDLRSRVRSVLLELYEGSLKFPGIVKAHLYDTFIKGVSRTPLIRALDRFVVSLTREMSGLFPARSARETPPRWSRWCQRSSCRGSCPSCSVIPRVSTSPPGRMGGPRMSTRL